MSACSVTTPAYDEACPKMVTAALLAGEAEQVAHSPLVMIDGAPAPSQMIDAPVWLAPLTSGVPPSAPMVCEVTFWSMCHLLTLRAGPANWPLRKLAAMAPVGLKSSAMPVIA